MSDDGPAGDDNATDALGQGDDSGPASDDSPPENDGHRFDRLPETADERRVPGRPTRREVVEWWEERFGLAPETFAEHTFWEKGNGKVWAVAGDEADPIAIEGLGMKVLRARQEHWKPTTDAVQRFGDRATRNVIELSGGEARAFVAGHDQELDWDGDWGYLIAATEVAGDLAPLGVGLYLHGELRSMVPKGRRRDLG